jgi:hypothetical protein
MAYDEYGYTDFHYIYDRIRASLYLHKLVKRFRIYIEYYLKYRIHQTFRYKFYKILKSIISPFISFHIICGDFVLELPVSRAKVPSLAAHTRHYPQGSASQQNGNLLHIYIFIRKIINNTIKSQILIKYHNFVNHFFAVKINHNIIYSL